MREIEMLDRVSSVLSSSGKQRERYAADLEWLRRKKAMWSGDRIRVGVMGVTSSGKSTLINALLGDELLSVAVRPSSSQLVSCSYADERSATVYFLNGEKETVGDNDRLKKTIVTYSDEKYNQSNEKQVAQLELSTPRFDLGKDILLIDSPGLDASGFDAHEKLTLEMLLPTVDIVILVTSIKSEVDAKMKQTLNKIAEYDCPVMIVQNMLDAARPSVDGTKSAAEVAAERMNRVRRAVAQSKLNGKSEVRISQISAKWAAAYRCHRRAGDEDKQHFDHSGYEAFVEGVKELVVAKRPEIERQRINTVGSHMNELIRQEDDRAGGCAAVSVESERVLDDIEKRINATHDAAMDAMETAVDELVKTYDRYFPEDRRKEEANASRLPMLRLAIPSFSSDKMTQTDINEIKRKVRSFEDLIGKEVGRFNACCREVLKQLNLPDRDMVSYNGLPSMPEAELKYNTIPGHWVDKPGKWNAIKRRFSFGDHHWGEEWVEPKKELDNAGTRQSVKSYLNRLIAAYQKTLDSWQKKTRGTILSIRGEIAERRQAIEDKQRMKMDAEQWYAIRADLASCLSAYTPSGADLARSAEISELRQTTVGSGTQRCKVPAILQRLHGDADNYIFEVQNAVLQYALQTRDRAGYPSFVVSNSPESLSDFLYRYRLSELLHRFFTAKNKVLTGKKAQSPAERVTAACAPTDDMLAADRLNTGRNFFLLTNGLEYHTNHEAALRKRINARLNPNDALFIVINDFDTLANGDGITECIRDIREDQSGRGIVLINHANPLYNMAVIHAQTTVGGLNGEADFYNSMSQRFPFWTNTTTKKHIHNILRTWSDDERRNSDG